MNPYKLHSPSTLVGNEQDRPANPWRHDAKHVSPHLIWQINPPQRASQKRRRKPSVSVMTSALLFSRGWHLPFVGGTFHSPPSIPPRVSFPLVRHSRAGGKPVITRTPLDSRLRGNDLLAWLMGLAWLMRPSITAICAWGLPCPYLCLAPTLICAWHLP